MFLSETQNQEARYINKYSSFFCFYCLHFLSIPVKCVTSNSVLLQLQVMSWVEVCLQMLQLSELRSRSIFRVSFIGISLFLQVDLTNLFDMCSNLLCFQSLLFGSKRSPCLMSFYITQPCKVGVLFLSWTHNMFCFVL